MGDGRPVERGEGRVAGTDGRILRLAARPDQLLVRIDHEQRAVPARPAFDQAVREDRERDESSKPGIGIGFAILRFDLKTPGREDEPVGEEVADRPSERGAAFVVALGGAANLASIDACTTRLRLVVRDQAKVDERRLPDPFGAAAAGVATRVPAATATERAVADVWSEVLRIPSPGVHDNFFQLGGHSLLAMQVMSRLRAALGVDLPLRALFDSPTVRGLSRYAEIALGAATLLTWRQPARARMGRVGALFFLGVFPGNVAQWLERKDGFGLDTDEKRLARLAFQPALMAWALYAGDSRRQKRLARG